jgi:hypothetical protein
MVSYEQMLHEHESVEAELRGVEEALDDAPTLLTRLGSLREILERHFAHEEEGGYLALVTDARPGLSPRVEALRDQHQEILGGLRRALDLGVDSDELRGAAESVAKTLREHEAGENELVLSAVNDDIGPAD